MYVVGVFYHGSTSVALSSTMPAMTKLTSALNYLVQGRNCLRSQLENLNGALSALKVTRNGYLRSGVAAHAIVSEEPCEGTQIGGCGVW